MIAILLASACDGACGKGKRAPPAAESDAATAAVELLAPGAEPRVKLEVARWAGLEYELSTQSDGSLGLAGFAPTKAPTARITLRFEVLRGTADPVVREREGRTLKLVEERAELVAAEVSGGQLPPPALEAVNGALRTFQGTTTKQLVVEDGEIFDVKTELVGGKEPPPDLKRILDGVFEAQRHFPFRLPHAAVGLGARWRFSEPLTVHGVQTLQVADMTLVAFEKNAVKVGIRVRHHAKRQELPHPLDPSVTATLDQYRGDADGHITIDRMTAVVLSARLATTSTITLTWVDAQGNPGAATLSSAQVVATAGRLGPFDDEAGVEAGADGAAAAPDATDGARAQSDDEDEDGE